MTHPVERALANIGRRLIGGFRTTKYNPYRGWNRYHGNRIQGRLGARERARHAGKPDGLMHRSPVVVRSNDWKRTQVTAPVETKARKPRAKKVAA